MDWKKKMEEVPPGVAAWIMDNEEHEVAVAVREREGGEERDIAHCYFRSEIGADDQLVVIERDWTDRDEVYAGDAREGALEAALEGFWRQDEWEITWVDEDYIDRLDNHVNIGGEDLNEGVVGGD